MRHYQHPIVTGKNWLTTELKSPLAFILKFCVLFHSRFVLVNFSGDSLSREPCILFLLLNICSLTLSLLKLKKMLGPKCMVSICMTSKRTSHSEFHQKTGYTVPLSLSKCSRIIIAISS